MSTTVKIYAKKGLSFMRYDYILDISEGPGIILKSADSYEKEGETTLASIMNLQNIALCEQGIAILNLCSLQKAG